jgi:hypothetical protein
MLGALRRGAQDAGLRGVTKASVQFIDQNDPANALAIATVYTYAGDNHKALNWLERSFDERTFGTAWLLVDPTFDSLRSEPRFQNLLHRLGPQRNQ